MPGYFIYQGEVHPIQPQFQKLIICAASFQLVHYGAPHCVLQLIILCATDDMLLSIVQQFDPVHGQVVAHLPC